MKTKLTQALTPLKAFGKSIAKQFQSKYEVVCTTYQVIPGMPVSKHEKRHAFERGAAVQAKEFYTKVVASDMTKMMAPVEVQLRKIYISNKTIERAEFGPVQQLKATKASKK